MQASLVIGDIGANLAIGVIKQGLGGARRATVTRAHQKHGVLLMIGNKTVYVAKQEVHARGGAPVAHQAMLDVGTAKIAHLARFLIDEILAHQRIGAQVNLADREVVGAAPVLLHPLELLAGNGCVELFPRRSDNGLSHVYCLLYFADKCRRVTSGKRCAAFPRPAGQGNRRGSASRTHCCTQGTACSRPKRFDTGFPGTHRSLLRGAKAG